MLKKELRKSMLFVLLTALLLLLGACSNANDENTESNESTETENTDESQENMDEDMEGMDHSNMDMSGSGEVPEGLEEAASPTYEVGSKAIIESDHMSGMKGAEATIVGAYDTTVYTISYTPTTGGERVENHKWVIHEELEEAGDEPLEPGTEVTVNAEHMEGMDGTTAEIDSAEQTTVYMVDFTPTTGGEEVKNHKWVTESELSPAE
ncbi:YdhK family protein [Bacillus sp. ISL-47]|uniref:YdhK family protein n=1 Tax=Bacillus sp. ISL-47 TaxID=2819130 RepID=UPI001BE7B5BD|nr:YdhK family protein [Bacillus sp. ISL-47]MBT2691313.1 YdhK family protein [Bacillus sp. ISL-47]MBT2710581.1 YdhK family protein [Pseudomonas sp. ISL-84]